MQVSQFAPVRSHAVDASWVQAQIRPGLLLRLLRRSDAQGLADYFGRLGDESRRRFLPHPLTQPAAQALCSEPDPTALRFVVAGNDRLMAYFILETALYPHEAGRFRQHGIELSAGNDFLFAPSVSDDCQNRGLASAAMPALLAAARAIGARSLVLMGGTQATNAMAIAFYEKFGFRRFGGYQTEVFNHDMRLVI
ncbi:GNAT family N-acetyltransferase [Nostoc sp. NIES-2111]